MPLKSAAFVCEFAILLMNLDRRNGFLTQENCTKNVSFLLS